MTTKPLFALQVTNRTDYELERTVKALDAAGLEWINFGVIPFAHELTNLEAFPTDRCVIPLAGTTVVDMYRRKKLPPNWRVVYDDSKFDQCYTRLDPIHLAMLNKDAQIYAFTHIKDHLFAADAFVKPSNDLKVFAGTIIPARTTLAQHLETINHSPIADYEQILVNKVHDLGTEYRLFMNRWKVLGASEYRRQGKVGHHAVGPEVMGRLIQFIDNLRLYLVRQQNKLGVKPMLPVMPAVYCMDLVDSDGRIDIPYQIVEFNCFHAAGMYEVDRGEVLSRVQDIFSEERV
jgi:hypothetical protein